MPYYTTFTTAELTLLAERRDQLFHKFFLCIT